MLREIMDLLGLELKREYEIDSTTDEEILEEMLNNWKHNKEIDEDNHRKLREIEKDKLDYYKLKVKRLENQVIEKKMLEIENIQLKQKLEKLEDELWSQIWEEIDELWSQIGEEIEMAKFSDEVFKEEDNNNG